MKKVELYTDGACSGNPGAGGWGAVLIYNGIEKEISGGFPDTTNNRMEIYAVIAGLKCLKTDCEVNGVQRFGLYRQCDQCRLAGRVDEERLEKGGRQAGA